MEPNVSCDKGHSTISSDYSRVFNPQYQLCLKYFHSQQLEKKFILLLQMAFVTAMVALQPASKQASPPHVTCHNMGGTSPSLMWLVVKV